MPELALWRAEFERVTGSDVVLAGSGSTLFVEGTRADHGLEGVEELRIAEVGAMLLDAVTVPKEVGEPKGL